MYWVTEGGKRVCNAQKRRRAKYTCRILMLHTWFADWCSQDWGRSSSPALLNNSHWHPTLPPTGIAANCVGVLESSKCKCFCCILLNLPSHVCRRADHEVLGEVPLGLVEDTKYTVTVQYMSLPNSKHLTGFHAAQHYAVCTYDIA